MTKKQLIEIIKRVIREETSNKNLDSLISNATPLTLFRVLNDNLGIRIYSGVSNFESDSDKGVERFKVYMNRGIEKGDFTEEDVINAFEEQERRYK